MLWKIPNISSLETAEAVDETFPHERKWHFGRFSIYCYNLVGHLISLDFTCFQRSIKTRPDTRLPQSRAGGQRLYLRSLNHLGRSSEATDRKNPHKAGYTATSCGRVGRGGNARFPTFQLEHDGPTNQPTDRLTNRRTDGQSLL